MKKTFFRLLSLLNKRERVIGLSLLISSLFASILEVGALGALVPLIAVLGHPDPTSVHPIVAYVHDLFGNPDRNTFAIYGLLGIGGIFLFKSLALSIIFLFVEKFNWTVSTRFGNELMVKYVNLPYMKFQARDPNEMVARLTGELRRNVSNSLGGIITIAGDFLFLIGVVGILLRTDPVIAGGGLSLIAAAATLFYFIVQKRSLRWGLMAKEGEYRRLRNARYSIMGFKELLLLHKTSFFVGKFLTANNQTARALANSAYVEKLARPWLELIAVIGLLTLALAFIKSGRSFDTLLPIMVLVAATGLRSLPAINRILTAIQRIRRASPFIDIAYDELSTFDPPVDKTSIRPLQSENTNFFKELSVQDLSFSYKETRHVELLKSINFKITSGQSVGIKGASGCGKSTLMDIMLGLITFTKGTITINGKPISECTDQWQRKTGYLSQQVFIFEGTLRENIAIGVNNNEIDVNALNSAVKTAQLQNLVDTLPNGLDTRVGESGFGISGGQRQRVGIARLLYRNPEILFMDEPTASLDKSTADELWITLKNWSVGKTTVVISHDPDILKDCDVLFELSAGRISAVRKKT